MPSSKPLSNRYPSRFRDLHKAAREKILSLKEVYAAPDLKTDPIYFVHQYTSPQDQEIVAFISSLLAFGQVKSIHTTLNKIFSLMGDSPYDFLMSAKIPKDMNLIIHRWVRGDDIVHLLMWMSRMIQKEGRVKNFFLKEFRAEESDIEGLLIRVMKKIKSSVPQSYLTRGFSYLFPSPVDGSPCKRACMFMRWMVRIRDNTDLGFWSEIGSSRLIIPLDTHVLRFAQKYKISPHQNPSWKMAKEVTEFLKTLDPLDPVSFDFPICHYGMEQGW